MDQQEKIENFQKAPKVYRAKYEKNAFRLKVIWFTISIIILVGGLAALIYGCIKDHNIIQPIGITFTSLGGVLTIFAFIFTFGIRIREYNHDGLDIWIYSGFYDHVLVVNDEIVDGVHTLIKLTEYRTLTAKYKDKYDIEVKMSLLGVTLRINGKMMYCKKIKGKQEMQGK